MNIGDLFYTLRAKSDQLMVDAKRAGEASAQTFGQGLAAGLRSSIGKAVLGSLAAGGALATKNLLELQEIQADFRAETGATAEEAERAGKAINAMSGRNLQPMREIGKALAKVHTDLGLTGDAAEETTESFLKFARVTKRDAAEEVASFDDILDAYGETADQIPGIMDKLVKSHQEYGGVIEDDERALAAMAPQLKAFNLGIDDGIALLNLFKASGLDAAKIPRALNSAIQKLDGRPIQDFVAELASIEDPGERARRAIEVFGSRAGVDLANALGPGIDSLDDFKISTGEAAGATLEAAAALDSTFTARVQLAIKAVTARITEFGAAFGPALTGLASLASLGAALGLDRILAGGWKKVAGSAAVRAAAAAAGAAIGAIYGAAAGAAEFVVDLVKDAWEEISAKAAIRAAAARAGGIVGAIYGAAVSAGIKLADILSAAFKALPVAAPLRAVVLASAIEIGSFMGTSAGAAFVSAFLAAVVVGIPLIGEAVKKEVEKQGGHPLLGNGLKETLDKQGPPTQILWFKFGQESAQTAVAGAAAGFGQSASVLAGGVNGAVQGAAQQIDPSPIVNRFADLFEPDAVGAGLKVGLEQLRQNIASEAGELATSLAAGGANLATVSAELARQMPDAVRANRDEVRRQAVLSMVDYAAGIRDKRAQVSAAIELLNSDIDNALSRRAEANELQAALGGENIAKGLASKDPVVRAQAQGTVQLIADRLRELEVDASKLGGAAGQNYADALGDTKPLVSSAATSITTGASTAWEAYVKSGYRYGYATGKQYADGLRATFGLVNDAAYYVGKGVGPLKPSSPPPAVPWIVDAGRALTALWAKGIASGVGLVRDAAGTLAGGLSGLQLTPAMSLASAVSVPSAGSVALPTLSAAAGPAPVAGKHIEYHIHAEGQLEVKDPLAAANLLARFQGQGMLPEGDE
ncbi:MAG TPA: phage tail tape measure protein [Candidatus Limnocylindrales bacterium]|nr:phage tail tape measure protein [Candidatus Limnocylindrales bacterium]